MLHHTASLLLVLPVALAAQDTRGGGQDAFASLVAAERSFAAAALRDGTRDAFLGHMAEGAIVFSPHATPARPLWTARAERPGLLGWAPALAGVSRAGDLGYTTGPWTWRVAADSPVVARGSFVTVWTRTPQGWRFLLDDGVAYDSVAPWPDTVAVASRPGSRTWRTVGVVGALRALDRADRGMDCPSTLFLRQQHAPAIGAAPPGAEPVAALAPEGGGVARSGDLAFTYGRAGKDGKANYLRIWRRDDRGRWRVVLDRRG
jgi:ketosteroid isomerase-like protein